MKRLLLVSNGHGEDAIAVTLARRLAERGFALAAVPLVGRGDAYAAAGLTVLGPRDEQPSGGLLLQDLRLLWGDLRAGWLRSARARLAALGRSARHADACVVVGDAVAVGATAIATRLPRFYLPSAVSLLSRDPRAPAWRPPFGALERRWMRHSAAVYPRDAATAGWLVSHGVAVARFLGNPMLDALAGDAGVGLAAPYLLLLPGSRSDAGINLGRMLEACRHLGGGPAPVIAWAGGPRWPQIDGWHLDHTGAERGVFGRYRHPDGTAVALARDAFGTLVAGARAALATTGTAAEQCAGHGVPVVAFAAPGAFYATFADRQKRVLGEALCLADDDPAAIAAAVRDALEDGGLRARAREAGRRAMGEPGGADRVAVDIERRLGSDTTPHPLGARAAMGRVRGEEQR